MSHIAEAAAHPSDLDLLPPGPVDVPASLTQPSPAFRRSAWIATLGLLGFVAVYLGLIGYFAWFVYRMVSGSNLLPGVLYAAPAAFFLAFLVRGLFVVKHAMDPASIEVTASEQPRLFAYLHRIADAAGAPRPHRVFVSARVNAAVFYDLSFRNLILPTKKNLEIGLGLVEALSLDEMKAVVAHEFGHFAQKSMAVGRWVYVARQVATHLVAARTGFDGFLRVIAGIDIRIAWVGWIMQLFVWAIRAILDTFLRLAILAHRALGRNMEFQADRVAVSVSGSDSLIHALHRIGPADDAWDAALRFSLEEAAEGRPVEDLFAIESAVLVHLRRILDEPELGATPDSASRGRADHRVFEHALANPPKMWATHPPNRDREDHAKEIYLPSALDPRSAWALFDDVANLRKRVTSALFAPRPDPKRKGAPVQAQKDPVPIAESLERLATRYRRASLDPRFRGSYLGRSVAGHHATPATMIAADRDDDRGSILLRIERLYPDSLRDLLERYREHREEEMLLEGLADGILSAPGGIVRHRGRELRRGELPKVLDDVRDERRAVEKSLIEHDAACRAAYLDAATELGQGWAPYLSHLTILLHYATHGARMIADAHSHLIHVLDIVLADGNVSAAERRRLVASASDLQSVLESTWRAHHEVRLPAAVEQRYEDRGGYKALDQKLGLASPTEQTIGDWLEFVDGWSGEAAADLSVLAEATLDVLLDAESLVGDHHLARTDPGPAPALGFVPSRYPTLVIGNERPRQKKLDLWDRFMTADGLLPGIARFGAASALIAPAMFLGSNVGTSTIHVYNGLARWIDVSIDGRTHQVSPYGELTLDHDGTDPVRVSSRILHGPPIESFTADVPSPFSDYVYNVAGAAVFTHWTAEYGNVAQAPGDRVVGAARFFEPDEDVILDRPPTSIDSGGSGGTRTVLGVAAPGEASPGALLASLPDDAAREALVRAHLLFEPYGSAEFHGWFEAARESATAIALVRSRAASAPFDVEVERSLDDALEESGDVAGHEAACARRRADSEAHPDDVGRKILAIRCLTDEGARDEAYVGLYPDHGTDPNVALAAAFAFDKRREYRAASNAFTIALDSLRSPRSLASAALESVRNHRAWVRAAVDEVPPELYLPERARAGFVGTILSIEGAAAPDDDAYVVRMRLLRDGDLGGFVAAATAVNSLDATNSVLVGASEGAAPGDVARALSIDVGELSQPGMFALLGLMVRERADPSAVASAIDAEMMKAGLRGFGSNLAAALRARDASALEALSVGRVLGVREVVLSAGLVAFGDAAPAAWRDEVHAVAFALERPYFR